MKIGLFLFLIVLMTTDLWAQDPRENFKFAKFNYDKAEYGKALEFLDKAINGDDLYVNAYFLRAETYYELKQYYNAILDVNRIFKMDKTVNASTSDYYLARGKSFLAIDDFSNADADIKKSISYSRTNAYAHYYMAKLRFDTKNYDDALAEIDTALMIDSAEPDFHALKAEVKITYFKPTIGADEYKEILSDINAAISLDEHNYKYYSIRSDFLKNMGEVERALEDYDAMIRLSPRSDDAYTSRGLVKMNRYEYSGAALDFTKSILLNPDIESNYRYRGLCYNNLSNFNAAYRDFSKSIDMLNNELGNTADINMIKNTLAETYILRGHCLNLMGNNAQACRDFLMAHNLGIKKGLNYYRKYCGIY
jgi:tetratricopeptide (TPR) repeat protein